MRAAARTLLLVALALAAPPAAADAHPTVRLTVEAHDDGREMWFTANVTGDARNPGVVVPPGARVEVTFVNRGRTGHNLHVDGGEDGASACAQRACATPFLTETGARAALTFTMPLGDAAFAYWCDPHRGVGMAGLMATSQEALDSAAEARGAPTPGASAGLLAAAVATAAAVRRFGNS